MSTIEVAQNRFEKLTDDNKILYGVSTIVSRALGIDDNLFVYSVRDDSFQYVATLYDLKKWPVSKEDALDQTFDFYRQNFVNVEFEDEPTADEAAKHHITRLRLVLKDSLALHY
jgi:hypothetical protein